MLLQDFQFAACASRDPAPTMRLCNKALPVRTKIREKHTIFELQEVTFKEFSLLTYSLSFNF